MNDVKKNNNELEQCPFCGGELNRRVPSPANTPTCQSMSANDWTRLRDWMIDPNRRKANSAFTAGPAREAAYAFESFLDALTSSLEQANG